MPLPENRRNLGITSKRGDTPLTSAACDNKMDTARALAEAGCDITILGQDSRSAAEWARKNGHDAIAEYLANEAPRAQAHSTHRARVAP